MKLQFLEYTKKEDIKVIEFPSKEANVILNQDKEISEYLDELNEHSVGELLIDARNDDLIGYVFVYKKKYPGFIYNVFVYPKYRGKGFGKRLTRDAIEKYNGIDLTVDKTNYRAIQLYKGFGFDIVGDGNTENEYYMKLKSEIDESFIMKDMTLYDFLKSGIEDIIEYNNGDKSKAKKYTIKENEFAYEGVETDFKLRIKESNDE